MKRIILPLIIFFNSLFFLYADEGTVFCIHGFLRSPRCMKPLARALEQKGLHSVLWDYPSRARTIEEHAEFLVGEIKKIAAESPGKPIHFVSHSLGGLIIRAALNHPDCPNEAKIGRALLLAPPNKGSRMARNIRDLPGIRFIFGNKAGMQLLTYDQKDIDSLGHFPEEMEVCVVAGSRGNPIAHFWLKEPNDGKVTVRETTLPTPHYHFIFSINHTWIMTHKRTILLAISFLTSPG